jgi:hypothetical protein
MKDIPEVIKRADIFSTPDIFIMDEAKDRRCMPGAPIEMMFYVRNEAEIVEALEKVYVYAEDICLLGITRVERVSKETYEIEILKVHCEDGQYLELVYLQRLCSWEQAEAWRTMDDFLSEEE